MFYDAALNDRLIIITV